MRRARTRTRMVALLSTALLALPAGAQQPAPAIPVAAAPLPPDVFAIEQLDAMLAPVALYPDALLAPLLMAASDPLQVVVAARWAAAPEHAALSGDALVAALAAADWDPDVKALVPFPGVLRMLNDNLDWTVQLGYAIANQPDAVLDSVQRLRRQALAAGGLAGSAQTTVRRSGAVVAIAPAAEADIAVPAIDPTLAYGAWPYVATPPVRISADATAAPAPPALRDLCALVWSRGEIVLDMKRWNAANADRPPIALSVWHPHAFVAVTGSADVSLGARPLPPTGPVGRPARPSGIPANAIGRVIVTVAADLVRRPAAPPPRPAGAPSAAAATTMRPSPLAVAQMAMLHLAPLPAHIETVRASALSDVNAGALASLFGARGAESRLPPASPASHQAVAGLLP